MDQSDETVIVIALAGLGLLLVFMVAWLIYQVRQRALYRPSQPTAPDVVIQQPKGRSRKQGTLIVCSETFEFDYKATDESEAIRLTALIKNSLQLLGESHHADIIASRAKETESLMKQLRHYTRFQPGELDRMIALFREYANGLIK